MFDNDNVGVLGVASVHLSGCVSAQFADIDMDFSGGIVDAIDRWTLREKALDFHDHVGQEPGVAHDRFAIDVPNGADRHAANLTYPTEHGTCRCGCSERRTKMKNLKVLT